MEALTRNVYGHAVAAEGCRDGAVAIAGYMREAAAALAAQESADVLAGRIAFPAASRSNRREE